MMKRKPDIKTKMIRFRASSLRDSTPLPFYLRACGWHTAQKGWTETNDGKERNYAGLFWCANGHGNFKINNNTYILRKGQVLFYQHFDSHHIEILSPSCTYYWATIEGPLVKEVLDCFGYPKTPFYAKGDLTDYFEKMYDLLYDLSPEGTQLASQALYSLLIAIGSHVSSKKNSSKHQVLSEQFVKLTSENFTNPNFNVNAAADILKVHRTTLGKAMIEHLSVCPSTYILNIRLQYALTLLSETSMKVADIGIKCGIPDPCYFSKLIKQLTGQSPGKLRNS